MSKSNNRRCAVCGAHAYATGSGLNGRRAFGGAELKGSQTMVNGRLVNAGVKVPVCETHRDMVFAVRAMAVQDGSAARQSAEAAILTASAGEQMSAANRAGRLDSLKRAAFQTLTADELALMSRQARAFVNKFARGSMTEAAAYDEIMDRFAQRVAEAAFREIGDDVDVLTAVTTVNRVLIGRGLGYVNINAQRGSVMGPAASMDEGHADAMGFEAGNLYDLIPSGGLFDRAGSADGFKVAGWTFGYGDVKALARELQDEPGEIGEAARALLAS